MGAGAIISSNFAFGKKLRISSGLGENQPFSILEFLEAFFASLLLGTPNSGVFVFLDFLEI